MKYDASLEDLSFPELIPPLFQAAKTYNRAMIAAEAARLSYFRFEEGAQSRQTIESALRIVGFEHVEYFAGREEKGHAIAALHASRNEALIAFRGTRPTKFKDIQIDLELLLAPWPEGGNVHEGFAKQFEELREPLRKWHERTGRRPLLLAGHSLGAGLATLCATVLKPNTLVTLGSSRVGDEQFVALLAGTEVHRFVNCCDVITRLPRILTYTHVGKARYIDRNGVELVDPTQEVIDRDCRSARWSYLAKYAWRPGNVWLRDAADHAPINYLSAILGEREN
jgi:hypothetical protein